MNKEKGMSDKSNMPSEFKLTEKVLYGSSSVFEGPVEEVVKELMTEVNAFVKKGFINIRLVVKPDTLSEDGVDFFYLYGDRFVTKEEKELIEEEEIRRNGKDCAASLFPEANGYGMQCG